MIKHIGRKKYNLIVIVCEGGVNTLKYQLFEKTLTNDGQNISILFAYPYRVFHLVLYISIFYKTKSRDS